MSLEHAILGFLRAQPATGYDLKTRCFDRSLAHLWSADQAQVYRTLARLEAAGLVTSVLVPQPGRPDRNVFSLTSAGRRTLLTWLAEPHGIPPLRDPFLLQVFFAAGVPDDELLALLRAARELYQSRLEDLRSSVASELDEWVRVTGATRDGALRQMALAGGSSVTRATIDWLDDSIERIAKGIPALASGANGSVNGPVTQ